ncbi:MAG: hypothetical protein RLZZ621_2456 [Gemmatimonadota bacterium]
MRTPPATLETPDATTFTPGTVGDRAAVIPAANIRSSIGRVETGDAVDGTPPARRSPLRRVLRVVRDLTIGMALVAAIPLTLIHTVGSQLQQINFDRARVNLLADGRMRPLRHPVDARIAPEAAGQALHRLIPIQARELFPLAAPSAEKFPWRNAQLDSTLFVGVRSTRWRGPESSQIITAAARGLPARERAWLQALAALPMWTDLDVVARAERIDILGQRFRIPFRNDAWLMAMPLPQFDALRQVAYAGVARAAHYVAIGEPAQAEAALQAVVSLGFALQDNGTTTMEAVMGRVVANLGRDGLHQLYATGYRAERLPLAAPPPSAADGPSASQRPVHLEAEALRDIADVRLPLAFRFERIGHLGYASCTSAWAVLRGPSEAARAMLVAAPTILARFESERAFLELIRKTHTAMPTRDVPPSAMLQLVQGAANVTSTVTGNVQIASCTRVIIGDFSYR